MTLYFPQRSPTRGESLAQIKVFGDTWNRAGAAQAWAGFPVNVGFNVSFKPVAQAAAAADQARLDL